MGLEESKIVRPHKNSSPHFKLCVSAPVVPWRVIHQCPIDLWIKSHRESFNFPDRPLTCSYQMPYDCTPAFCLSRQNIINFRKSCSVFSLRKRKKSSKMAEHFEYNHLPARLSSIQNLHFKSVLATHSGLAVVHLARDLVTQFAVLDLRINKFLGTFGRQTVTVSPESTTGKISPDGCWCLIKLPSSRNRRVSVLKLYDLRSCELLTELLLSPIPRLMFVPLESSGPVARGPLLPSQVDNTSGRFPTGPWVSPATPENAPLSVRTTNHSVYRNGYQVIVHRSAPILYAFDPRFFNSRIAITNLSPNGTDEDNVLQRSDDSEVLKASLSLLKLPTWERIATTMKFKCSTTTPRPLSMSNPSRSQVSSGQQNASSSGGMLRTAQRRRRSSDANHGAEPLLVTSNLPFPHILNIFYSRDGYLLFTVSTDQRVCKCSTLGHLAPGSNCSSADSIDLIDDPGRNSVPNLSHRTPDGARLSNPSIVRGSENTSLCYPLPEGSTHQTCTVLPRQSERTRHTDGTCHSSAAVASPPPGCTALWLTIFNSDNLARLRTLRFDRAICPIHTCPTNYMPVMSRCGSRLALLTNQYVCQTVFNQRPITSPAYYGARSGSSSNNLRHSIPSVTVDALTRAHFNGHRVSESREHRSSTQLSKLPETNMECVEINRTLATSSPSLPPFEHDDAIVQSGLGVDNQLSSSFPTPLARVHFAENLAPTRQTHRTLDDCQPSACSSSPLYSVPIMCSSAASVPPTASNTTGTNRRQIEVVLVYQLPPPPTLQALVRRRILQFCREEMLDKLDLPPQMINFLRFQPVFCGAGSYLSRSSSFTPTLQSVSLDSVGSS